MSRPMTVADLIAALVDLPSDAPMLVSSGASEHPMAITEVAENDVPDVFDLEGDIVVLPAGVYPILVAVEVPYLIDQELSEFDPGVLLDGVE